MFLKIYSVFDPQILMSSHGVPGTVLFTVGDRRRHTVSPGPGGQREGCIIHRQSGFHPPPCAGPSTGYLRAILQIRRYFHFAPGESRWVLEMQTLRPQPALPNENLHFNKLPRDLVLLQVGEALLWKHQKLWHVAGWWFLLFSGGKKEMEIRRKKWNA